MKLQEIKKRKLDNNQAHSQDILNRYLENITNAGENDGRDSIPDENDELNLMVRLLYSNLISEFI